MLGTLLHERGQYNRALVYLNRVRLDGPFSNRALLSAGWANMSGGRPNKAIVSWGVLAKRDATDRATQEAMLALPYAYGQMDLHSQAAAHYSLALNAACDFYHVRVIDLNFQRYFHAFYRGKQAVAGHLGKFRKRYFSFNKIIRSAAGFKKVIIGSGHKRIQTGPGVDGQYFRAKNYAVIGFVATSPIVMVRYRTQNIIQTNKEFDTFIVPPVHLARQKQRQCPPWQSRRSLRHQREVEQPVFAVPFESHLMPFTVIERRL